MQNRALLLAVLFLGATVLASCGRGSTPTTPRPSTPTQGSNVSIVQGSSGMTTTAFNPNPITIAHGGTVTWKNNDTITHTSRSDTGAWNSGSIGPGGTFSMTFTSAGTFTYHCALHPGMVGTVIVQ